jgi:hypothetical protein
MTRREFTRQEIYDEFFRQRTDKVKYSQTYAEVFSRIDPKIILEIGVAGGGGIRAFRTLFPEAKVYGIDYDPNLNPDECHFVGDQADSEFLERVIAQTGQPDLVIDDGSHRWSDLRTSFDVLFPHVTEGGLYVVEDLETSYVDFFGDDEPFTEFLKSLLDVTVHEWTNEMSVCSMHLYPRLAVLEKGTPTLMDLGHDWKLAEAVLTINI